MTCNRVSTICTRHMNNSTLPSVFARKQKGQKNIILIHYNIRVSVMFYNWFGVKSRRQRGLVGVCRKGRGR